jgi:hypothetical protein
MTKHSSLFVSNFVDSEKGFNALKADVITPFFFGNNEEAK